MRKYLYPILALTLLAMPASAQEIVPQSSEQVQLTFAPLVKRTAPAVVNIYAKVKVRQRVVSPFFADPFFSQFFGGPGYTGTQERIENALGSGVIVDASGIIATNTHVVKDATEIMVVTSDGREFPAKKTLDDEKTDLAVLKIDTGSESLPYLSFSDSDAVQVGDLVLAIGNPFGVGQTVTSGIVSGLARTGVGTGGYSSFIQTDAAINPGNSGGALIDMKGNLIGVNSMIFSRDGGSLGIGFAIPANMVKTVITAAKQGSNKIIRPWTGVVGQAVTPDMVESLGLKRAYGTLINTVNPISPAAKAGLQPGDVILTLDGRDVQSPQDMRFRLATIGVGKAVEMTVQRRHEIVNLTMTTEPPPETPPRDTTTVKGVNPLQGAILSNINPALVEDMDQNLPKDTGVVIERVTGGIAARMGLKAGDIVLALNGVPLPTVSDVLRETAKAQTPRWELQLQRGSQILNLVLKGN